MEGKIIPGARISEEFEALRREMAKNYNISKLESDRIIAKIIKNSGISIEFTIPKGGKRKSKPIIKSERYNDFSIF